MSILQAKKDIEQFFFDNWTDTEIHWSGMKFSIDGRTEWIRLEYKPTIIESSGISVDKMYNGQIKMAIFSASEFRSYALSDIALELFANKKIGVNFTSKARILNTGITNDDNFHYIDILVEITTY